MCNMNTPSAGASLLLALTLAGVPGLRAQAPSQDARTRILQDIEARRQAYGEVATQIWTFAEVGYQESRSSALLQEKLGAAGFSVKAGVAGMPTAFVASFGSGRPVIAFVGEFDALPGMSQGAVPARQVLQDGAPGHGCGHNLLGTASMAAAIAVKDWLASSGRAGTVRYYGTPAEEGGGAKGYMVRDGLFDDVDAAIAWHPGDANDASPTSNLAIISARFRFHGVAAHAAAAPDRGRSALDAVEAMNHMVDMMREHVPSDSRIHYVITRGGAAVNIVPDFAEVLYAARNPDMRVLDGIWKRIVDAAKGAALGTGTTVDVELESASYNILPNGYLADLQRKNMLAVGGVKYSAEERAFAETLRKTLEGRLPPLGSEEQVQPVTQAFTPASTDLGDVSWKVPTTEVTAATWVPGVPAHSWQAVACDGMSIGIKGMMVAAKTMALTGLDLFGSPDHVAKARAEFDQRRGGETYTFKLGDRKPPLDYRK
jgi:aminobenzoyl-glutamate utilization protein B